MTEFTFISNSRSRGDDQDHSIAIWLFIVAGLVFAMVLLGGVTRLTGSGLSIVDWEPIKGIFPPFSHNEWLLLFEKYKLFPEYNIVNPNMNLADFKEIYWFEWSHRLLGRIIGIVFLIPFLWFLFRRKINLILGLKLALILILGALQALLGWYMVESGLVDKPDVSPYRLAAHLGLAIVIFSFIFWTALGLVNSRSYASSRQGIYSFLRITMPFYLCLVFFTILSGAFLAGNDAGYGYNTFPLMDGKIIPPDIFSLTPTWRNFFENPPLVQLDHRLIAELTAIIGILVAILGQTRRLPLSARRIFLILGFAVLGQFLLGVSTLLLVVPIPLAAAHQAGAILLLSIVIWSCHELYRSR